MAENIKITIQDLPEYFSGRASTRKFQFTKVAENDVAALYVVNTGETLHYEMFKKKTEKVCLDFQLRIYSETEFKYKYPNDNAFGVWAWTTGVLERAGEIYTGLSCGDIVEEKILNLDYIRSIVENTRLLIKQEKDEKSSDITP